MTIQDDDHQRIRAEVEKARSSPSRLAAVRDTGLLDGPQMATLARVSRLAAQLVDVPVSFVSLIESDREFYASQCGLPSPLAEEREFPGLTFSHLVLVNNGPLVIEDTSANPLHKSVSMVASMGIGAFLGIPIKSVTGEVIGSFCAMEFRPRKWSERDQKILGALAVSAEQEIRLVALVGAQQRETDHAMIVQKASVAAARSVLHAVAHDMRTPISTIALSLVLIKRIASEPEVAKPLEIAERQILSLRKMLDDLLDGARIDSGTLHLYRERIPVSRLLWDLIEDFSGIASAADISLTAGPVAADVAMTGDRARIMQILGNLVSNALKFTPKDGSVSVNAAVVADTVEIRVWNSGETIPTDAREKVFEPFWQAQPDRAGLGLGLAIARNLAELHAGRLYVSEEAGSGNTFVLALPYAA